jgi:hypothetical protein
MDVSAYRGFNRCPVLVCSKSKEKGTKNTCFKPCSNPSKFHSMGQHFCGVHKFTFIKCPKALDEGRLFACKSDVTVCSRIYGLALAYSLNEAHVVTHCERVGATAGMRMNLPFNLLLTSKDAELRSAVPRAIPELASTKLSTDEQEEYGKAMFGSLGKGGSSSSENGDDEGDETTSRDEPTDTDQEGTSKGLRIAPKSGVGPRMEIDYGRGSASSQKAKQDSK